MSALGWLALQVGAGVAVDAFIKSGEGAGPGLAGTHRLGLPRAVDTRQTVALVPSEVRGDFVGRRILLGHQSVSGWLAHQVGWLDLERVGEAAHGFYFRRLATLDPLDGGPVDTSRLGELSLFERTLGAPVAQGGQDRGGSGRHRAPSERTGPTGHE